jgi:hypothetical protein
VINKIGRPRRVQFLYHEHDWTTQSQTNLIISITISEKNL